MSVVDGGEALDLSRYVLARIWRDRRRAMSVAVVLALAVGSFLLLSGAVHATAVRTVGTVNGANSTYDVLMRPADKSGSAHSQGLVRPNFLSGTFGGITLAQLARIRGISGVQVAAPIAMVGEAFERIMYPIDVTKYVRPGRTSVFRFRSAATVLRGNVRLPGESGYVLVGDNVSLGGSSNVEQIGKRRVRVCVQPDPSVLSDESPFSAANMFSAQCWDTGGGVNGDSLWPAGQGQFIVQVPIVFPIMIAAVDPSAENQLDGLSRAVSAGTSLAGSKVTSESDGYANFYTVPAIASSRTYVDDTTSIRVDELDSAAVRKLTAGSGMTASKARDLVMGAGGKPIATRTVTAVQAHDSWLNGGTDFDGTLNPTILFQPGPVQYTGTPETGLTARLQPRDDSVWRTYTYSNVPWPPLPPATNTRGFRTITPVPESGPNQVQLQVVGQFDPARLTKSSDLAKVPMETYQPPTATPADAPTRALLHGKALAPDGNPRGYLQEPPMLLVPMSALPRFADSGTFTAPPGSNAQRAPISAIRVRVAHAAGNSATAQARVRLVANQIQQATGLRVDVTKGSSPSTVRVTIPSTARGVPTMTVDEQWSRLGVATLIVNAIDRKTLALLILIVIASAVAVTISANASVRARRQELGVLACIGWRPRTIRLEVIAELCLIGLVAGALGSVAALLTAPIAGVHVTSGWYAVAVPAAALLAVAAGLLPAWAAGRVTPVEVTRPSARATHTGVRLRGVRTMAITWLARTPGRAAAGAISLAFGVCAVAILLGILRAFHGAVVGTVLGAAVTVQVRAPDLVAAGVLALIGVLSLVNILYLDLREQAPRYATLQATGWRRLTLVRLIMWQAIAIAIAGAAVGVLGALVALDVAVGLDRAAVLTTVSVGVVGVLIAALASLIPATAVGRRPNARLLSAE
ncbi:FtsX-like permease family protein [Flexivirga caeni]|uniref:FtsX-like permease family protein n=1 Tax=Flexivirga caeni TaxID=2294115 RepID=A0A3M9M9B0_9MICO|nr:FtsX-like permease family protein [Flexivirga caeni]RNI22132.1 FtsX-like permease family protein [Flexivirga caeni]